MATGATGRSLLVAWMVLAILAITVVAWWDSRREWEAVLGDVAREETVLASIVALDLRAHLEALEHGTLTPSALVAARPCAASSPAGAGAGATIARFVVHVPQPAATGVERTLTAADLLGEPPPVVPQGEQRILLAPPGARTLYALDCDALVSPPLQDGLDRDAEAVRLSRSDAAHLGLWSRTAMAGLAHVNAGPLGRWGVIAVGTAARARDRESRAFWRLVIGVGFASILVLAFGGIALRNQRNELEAQRELAVGATLRARDERLARAERVATMGTFAMGVAHEVATPLGVILARAEQLSARAGQDDRTGQAARAIMQQVGRIQLVVRRFLDIARGGPPSLAPAPARELVAAAASSVKHRFERAHVSLAIEAAEDLPEIRCDRALLEHALVNLLLNACDACAPGGRARLVARPDGEHVRFLVIDDGVGIRPEDAARAQESFFTTKPAGRGTGLGLAIASEIAKIHRGELTIAPDPERGTRASILVPVAGDGRS